RRPGAASGLDLPGEGKCPLPLPRPTVRLGRPGAGDRGARVSPCGAASRRWLGGGAGGRYRAGADRGVHDWHAAADRWTGAASPGPDPRAVVADRRAHGLVAEATRRPRRAGALPRRVVSDRVEEPPP